MHERTLALLKARLEPETRAGVGDRTLTIQKLKDMTSGNQWGPNGAYWRGRRPSATSGLTMLDVERVYTEDDEVGPCLDRLTGGYIGDDPDWNARTEDQDPDGTVVPELVTEVEGPLTAWHHDADLHRVLYEADRSKNALGESFLRVYIPDDYAAEAFEDSQLDLVAALELVHVQFVDRTKAGRIVDEHGRERGYYYRYGRTEDGVEREYVEVHEPETVRVYRHENGSLTEVVPVLEDGRPAEAPPNPLYDPARRRRPRYLMHCLERPGGSCVTPSVADKQARLNVAWTNMGRNDDLAGFRTVYTTNAEVPKDDKGNEVPWTFGPAQVPMVEGAQEVDATTNLPTGRRHTPTVGTIDPVDPARFSHPTVDKLKVAIRSAFDQEWTLYIGNLVSGEAMKQSRSAFDERLERESQPVARALVWALETALGLAAWLTGEPDRYRTVTFTPLLKLRVSSGDLAEFQANVAAAASGFASVDTVVDSNPSVRDVAGELKRLAEQRAIAPPAPAGA